MYCRNCGEKILDNDKFCFNCGIAINNTIHKDYNMNLKTNKNTNNISKEISKQNKDALNKLPMNWWNFCKYFRFPLGLAFSLTNISLTLYNVPYITIQLFIHICYVVLLVFTYYNFIKETYIGYNLLIFSLFFELFYNSISYSITDMHSNSFTQTFIIYMLVFGLFYVLPSYIYFTKRKYVFEANAKP